MIFEKQSQQMVIFNFMKSLCFQIFLGYSLNIIAFFFICGVFLYFIFRGIIILFFVCYVKISSTAFMIVYDSQRFCVIIFLKQIFNEELSGKSVSYRKVSVLYDKQKAFLHKQCRYVAKVQCKCMLLSYYVEI